MRSLAALAIVILVTTAYMGLLTGCGPPAAVSDIPPPPREKVSAQEGPGAAGAAQKAEAKGPEATEGVAGPAEAAPKAEPEPEQPPEGPPQTRPPQGPKPPKGMQGPPERPPTTKGGPEGAAATGARPETGQVEAPPTPKMPGGPEGAAPTGHR